MHSCPACRKALVRCQNEFGNFWHCGHCDGTAVTLSLLRQFADGETMNRLWQGSQQFERPRKRECPGWNNRMEAVPLDLPVGQREIDVCDRCQFIWLDASEWDGLPKKRIEPSEPEPTRESSNEQKERIAIDHLRRIDEEAYHESILGTKEWWRLLPALLKMPIEEMQPTFGVRPVATWGLAALILTVSLLAFRDLGSAINNFGLIPAELFRGGGLTLISSFFIHASIFHLIGNLYFLLTFGNNVEHFLGPFKFLCLLGMATLGGDLLHILIDPGSTIPCIGASGGISGVMAFYALKFPKARISVLMFYFPGAWLRLTARWMFAIWIAQQAYIIWQQTQGYGSVSGAAHLGGVFVGTLFWLLTKEPAKQAKGTRGSIFER